MDATLSSEARTLLELTAAAVSAGELTQEARENLDDWILDAEVAAQRER